MAAMGRNYHFCDKTNDLDGLKAATRSTKMGLAFTSTQKSGKSPPKTFDLESSISIIGP